jgi:hypothetical protein
MIRINIVVRTNWVFTEKLYSHATLFCFGKSLKVRYLPDDRFRGGTISIESQLSRITQSGQHARFAESSIWSAFSNSVWMLPCGQMPTISRVRSGRFRTVQVSDTSSLFSCGRHEVCINRNDKPWTNNHISIHYDSRGSCDFWAYWILREMWTQIRKFRG